ncbi:MAG: hypothetical protein QE269_04930 [Fimbriimonas sp.]|jgi:hypothetical protein|nr:hypothetical protein [Fimbriimonas sp.]
MAIYILLMQDDDVWQTFSDEEKQGWISKIRNFAMMIEERVVQADPVKPIGRFLSGDSVEVVDYTGDAVAPSGYFIFQAEDWDDAVGVAKLCPSLEFGGRLQLREIGH